MNGSRMRSGRKAVSATHARTSSSSAPSSKMNRKSSNGSERNPLIEDLFDDLSNNSDAADLECLQGESVSNRGSFSEFKNGMRRASTAASTSVNSGLNAQSKIAVDVICKTAQHFVHAMRMHELDDFFSPQDGLPPEEALHRQLAKMTPEEVESVVQVLVELLEDVRKARAQVAPFSGSSMLLDGRERTMSTSMFSTMSTASLMRPPVHETNQLAVAYDQQGNRMINCYTIIANLGQGAYGKVKLGVDASTGQNVAIKIIDKKHLKKKMGGLGTIDQDAALKREIAIMKKVRHRNCVSLYEVIDDPASNKLYLIMDYVPNGPVVRLKPQQFSSATLVTIESGVPLNGDVYNKYLIRCAVRQCANGGDTPLTPKEVASQPTIFACKPVPQYICALYLRQLVSGLRYMHKRHLVHHDIKPDNILLGSDHHVFLTDFGVSEILSSRNSQEKEAMPVGDHSSEGSNHHNTSSNNNNNADAKKERGNNDSSAASLGAADNRDGTTSGGGGGGGGPKLGGGTLLFTSPELFDPSVNQNEVDPYLTDVWALGVTLYCMLVGVTPFFGMTLPEVRQNIMTQAYPWNAKNLYEAPLVPEWRAILDGLLEKDPKHRWTLLRLKSYLDQDSFQETMRQAEARDEAVRAAARATTEAANGGASKTPQAKQQPPSKAAGSPVMAGPGSLSSQSNRVLSVSTAQSVLSMDSAKPVNNFYFGFDVSQAEVSQATRAAKVEVTERRLVVSPHTREILQRWMERVRQRLRKRNYVQLSSFTSPVDAQLSAGASSKATQKAADEGKAGAGNHRLTPHFTELPVLSVAGSFHHTSASPIANTAAQLRSPAHGDSRLRRRLSRASRGSGYPLDMSASNGMRNGGSQSIDAILSIVNLASTSNGFSHSFSFGSSSDSSSDSDGPAAPVVTETVPATAALTPADTRMSDAVSLDVSSTSTPNPPGNPVAETVMWCGTDSPPPTETHHPEGHDATRESSRDGHASSVTRRKVRVGKGFFSSDIAAMQNSQCTCNGESRSETSDSTRKQRADLPSAFLPSASPTTNSAAPFSLQPLSRTGPSRSSSVGSATLQPRLSTEKSPLPVLSSVENVEKEEVAKRPWTRSFRLRK